jgi:lysophospholipase L1-like esterase
MLPLRGRRKALAALAAALTACCTAGPVTSEAPAPSTAPRPLATAPAPVSAPDPAGDPVPVPAVATASRHEGPLAAFYEALAALERGERKEHVRVLWLGDSHAQADFWPDALRRALQQRFGNGGPGFLHVGMDAYRHAGVRFELVGKWRMRPKKPSSVEPWGDGAFGLGGILNAGWQGKRAAIVELTDERLAGKPLVFDLCYKLATTEDSFKLAIAGGAEQSFAGAGAALGTLVHHEVRASALKLVLSPEAGRPDFCGLVVETDPAAGAGVVVDNLGINGARYATALAWNEGAWAAEVARRAPELFIFEYGGNEASDLLSQTEQYKKDALALIGRARRTRPGAACLVVGPSDRADAESRIPPIVEAMRAAATEAGCAFFDTYAVMGGQGSLRIWRDADKAADDGIHLKPRGYAELGALFVAEVMAGYRGTPGGSGATASAP